LVRELHEEVSRACRRDPNAIEPQLVIGRFAAHSSQLKAGREFTMALLERVATLVRANLNDLIDKAEEPEKMIKQVILDMQNQLLQVKTQVAIAIADQHLLE
jgi:site-specific recombinase XerC